MSYKALYRTYRPQTFEEMAGQKHILRTLENALALNVLMQSLLPIYPFMGSADWTHSSNGRYEGAHTNNTHTETTNSNKKFGCFGPMFSHINNSNGLI